MNKTYISDSKSTELTRANVTDPHVKEEVVKKSLTFAERVKRGESFLANQGLFVLEPINALILFTESERAILDIIRHNCRSEEFFLSNSAICLQTGISSNKTVVEAIKRLTSMQFVRKGKVSKKGTHYELNYIRFNNAIYKLNNEKIPLERLKLADSIRGEGNEIHSKYINTYIKTINNKTNKVA